MTAVSDEAVVARTLRGMWPSLPVLLVASAATCAAATLPVLAAPGLNPVSLLVGAVAVGPFGTALAATLTSIALDGEATLGTWWRDLRRLWLFGVRQALLVATVAILFLAALEVWSRHGGAWALPSLAITGTATALAVPGLFAVLPLGAARPTLRGYRLWLTALHLVARHPARYLAPLCVLGLGIWAGTAISAALLLLVPVPTTAVTVLATWTSVADMASAARQPAPPALQPPSMPTPHRDEEMVSISDRHSGRR